MQYTDEQVIGHIRQSAARKKPSQYKGVCKHSKSPKWEARLGTQLGKK